ncbi:MAG: hypothetical protein FH753_12330 [Firmicutes bacterium]|nr:hypothetical protein [Bacillota bacterium]
MCNIGKPALKSLRKCLYHGEYIEILEAIDAIGYISYYENDFTYKYDIVELLNKYKNDDLMIWKLLRAFQSFKCNKVQDILKKYSMSNVKQHRWEAIRSLKQIDRRVIQ